MKTKSKAHVANGEEHVPDKVREMHKKPNILAISGDETDKDFPPCQKAASFTIDQALEKMAAAGTGGGTGATKKAA